MGKVVADILVAFAVKQAERCVEVILKRGSKQITNRCLFVEQ